MRLNKRRRKKALKRLMTDTKLRFRTREVNCLRKLIGPKFFEDSKEVSATI